MKYSEIVDLIDSVLTTNGQGDITGAATNNVVATVLSHCFQPVGTIVMFAGTTAPTNWALCNAQALDITLYPDLYAVIGYTYGQNQPGFMRVPDLRTRFPLGYQAGTTFAYQLGLMAGASHVTLEAANIPAHTHELKEGVDSPQGSTHGFVTENQFYENDSSGVSTYPQTLNAATQFSIMPLYTVVNYIIKIK